MISDGYSFTVNSAKVLGFYQCLMGTRLSSVIVMWDILIFKSCYLYIIVFVIYV